MRNQLDPAQNEGPHDQLAKLAVGLDECQEVVAIQLDHFARLTCLGTNKCGTTRQHAHLSGKLTRSMERYKRLGVTGWQDNLDLTCCDDEEGHDPLSCLDEHLSRPDWTYASQRGDPFNLRRGELREHTFHT